MTTAQKREKFIKDRPKDFDLITTAIETGEYRIVDGFANSEYVEKHIKDYIITLLCDELIKLTNEVNQ